MRMDWVTLKPNGKPIQPGTFARRLDMEDGTNPIYYYGATEQDVNDKIALNSMHAQQALARHAQSPAPQGGAAQPTEPVAPRKRLNGDEVMRATVDMQNPEKSAEAVTKLIEDATGVDFKKMAMDAFKERAEEWIEQHEEFYDCKPNRALLATRLGVLVNGDVSLITKELMTRTFQQMTDAGELVAEPQSSEPQSVTPFPDESQVQRVETSRNGRPGTGTRSTHFRTPQNVQTRTLKYTRAQFDSLPLKRIDALIRSNDKDYAEAAEFYYPSAVKATA